MEKWEVCNSCDCDLHSLFALLGKRWTLLILNKVSKGGASFNELKAFSQNKISPILISSRLKGLTRLGIIDRISKENHIRYRLTQEGKNIHSHVLSIRDWAKEKELKIPSICGD